MSYALPEPKAYNELNKNEITQFDDIHSFLFVSVHDLS